jgi:hypothetical protein
LKLGLVTAIDSEAKTVILAASLVLHEDAPSFEWVFSRFKAFFGDPRIVFTDSDQAMANAILAVRLTSLSRLNFSRGFLQSRRMGPNMGSVLTPYHPYARAWWEGACQCELLLPQHRVAGAHNAALRQQ